MSDRLTKFTVRTTNGERVVDRGTADSYERAQEIALESSRQISDAVYLWFGDRAPVMVSAQLVGQAVMSPPDIDYSAPLAASRRLLRSLRAANELLSDGPHGMPCMNELNAAARLVDATLEIPEIAHLQSNTLRTLQYRASCEAQLMVHACRTVAALSTPTDDYPPPELVMRLRAQRAEAELATLRLIDAIIKLDEPAIVLTVPEGMLAPATVRTGHKAAVRAPGPFADVAGRVRADQESISHRPSEPTIPTAEVERGRAQVDWDVRCLSCNQSYGQRGEQPSKCGACGSNLITVSATNMRRANRADTSPGSDSEELAIAEEPQDDPDPFILTEGK